MWSWCYGSGAEVFLGIEAAKNKLGGGGGGELKARFGVRRRCRGPNVMVLGLKCSFGLLLLMGGGGGGVKAPFGSG